MNTKKLAKIFYTHLKAEDRELLAKQTGVKLDFQISCKIFPKALNMLHELYPNNTEEISISFLPIIAGEVCLDLRGLIQDSIL